MNNENNNDEKCKKVADIASKAAAVAGVTVCESLVTATAYKEPLPENPLSWGWSVLATVLCVII